MNVPSGDCLSKFILPLKPVNLAINLESFFMDTISFVPIFNIGILYLNKFLIFFFFKFNEKIIADAKKISVGNGKKIDSTNDINERKIHEFFFLVNFKK